MLTRIAEELFFFFGPQVEVPPSTLRFTVLHNDPAAPQDRCGRCRIQTQDLCARSLARYQMSHHISQELWIHTKLQESANLFYIDREGHC